MAQDNKMRRRQSVETMEEFQLMVKEVLETDEQSADAMENGLPAANPLAPVSLSRRVSSQSGAYLPELLEGEMMRVLRQSVVDSNYLWHTQNL